MVARSPMDAANLLKKLQPTQQDQEMDDGHREFFPPLSSLLSSSELVSPAKGTHSVTSPRKIKWQSASSHRHRHGTGQHQQQQSSFSMEGEVKSPQHDHLNNHRNLSPMYMSNTPRNLDQNNNLITVDKRDMAASSWVGIDPIADLDSRILRMHEAMAKLLSETIDLSKQTIELKEKTRGLLQQRQNAGQPYHEDDCGFHVIRQQQRKSSSYYFNDNDHKDDDAADEDDDDDDDQPKGLSFVPSTGDLDMEEETCQHPPVPSQKENLESTTRDHSDDDTLQSLSAEILQMSKNQMQRQESGEEKSANSSLSISNSKKWRRSNTLDESLGVDGISAEHGSIGNSLPGRRSKSASRFRSSPSASFLSSPHAIRPPISSMSTSSPSSIMGNRRAVSLSTPRARRWDWDGGEENKVITAY
ncbi:hypothetical protein ACA910_004960 [Epithemia clementina (nom. ined.)]